MEDLNKAIELAMDCFKKQYGDNAKIEEDETVVFSFNNATLIMRNDDGNVRIEFIGDRPIEVDYTLKIYE